MFTYPLLSGKITVRMRTQLLPLIFCHCLFMYGIQYQPRFSYWVESVVKCVCWTRDDNSVADPGFNLKGAWTLSTGWGWVDTHWNCWSHYFSVLWSIFLLKLCLNLDGCFRKRKESCLPPYVTGWNQFFCRGRWNRKLELSQKVMNTPCATWENGLIFYLDIEQTLVKHRHCTLSWAS